jgi:hypothetical protein
LMTNSNRVANCTGRSAEMLICPSLCRRRIARPKPVVLTQRLDFGSPVSARSGRRLCGWRTPHQWPRGGGAPLGLRPTRRRSPASSNRPCCAGKARRCSAMAGRWPVIRCMASLKPRADLLEHVIDLG